MSGTDAELQQMKFASDEVVRIGDELRRAVTQLSTFLESGLGTMDGQIKNAFWQGRNTHVEAVDRLCATARQMSDGIATSKHLYESHDTESHAAFAKASGSGAIDVNLLT